VGDGLHSAACSGLPALPFDLLELDAALAASFNPNGVRIVLPE
jgi:hypothetical protein